MQNLLAAISRLIKSHSALWLGLAMLVFWEIASQTIDNDKLMPSSYYVLCVSLPSIAVFSGYGKGDLFEAIVTLLYHSAATLLRIVVGLTLGITLGLFLGLAIHFFRESEKGSSVILTIARSSPLFALIPLFLFWFGGREAGVYVYIAFAVSVVVATNTYEAALNVSPGYIRQAMVLRATRFQVFRTVMFYAIQPEMIGSLRSVVGLSWAYSLGAEYMAARSGVGYLLYQSYLYADMGKLIVFAGLYAAYGLVSFAIMQRTFRYFIRWR